MRVFYSAALAAIFIALPVYAQDNAALSDRLNRLERDVNFMQRQVYNSDGSDAGGAPANASQILVQIGQLQEDMRALRGQVEQVQFANRRQAEETKKLSEDVEFRLNALEKAQQARTEESPEAAEEAASEEEGNPFADAEEEGGDEEGGSGEEDSSASYQPEEKEEKSDTTATTKRQFASANAHYSYAFKLMNDRKFSAASESFEAFVKKYPADPLIANAYYWLGESYYVRSEFASAAESFRKGFEADAKSQKAPDNLLKLGMSLGALKQKDQACVVYKQLIRKYGARAPETRTRAQREYGQLGCR